jgi:hypothetical protein
MRVIVKRRLARERLVPVDLRVKVADFTIKIFAFQSEYAKLRYVSKPLCGGNSKDAFGEQSGCDYAVL